MKIEKNKVVSVTYDLFSAKEGAGEKSHVESTDKENPLTFLYGAGSLIPAFEENLSGKQPGEPFEFEIPASEAYGEKDEEYISRIPIKEFGEDVDLSLFKPGSQLKLVDQEGHDLFGKVLNMDNETVTIDFNHKLAGHNLHFKGEVIEVRDASKDEIAHGHAHGPGGHQH